MPFLVILLRHESQVPPPGWARCIQYSFVDLLIIKFTLSQFQRQPVQRFLLEFHANIDLHKTVTEEPVGASSQALPAASFFRLFSSSSSLFCCFPFI